MKSINSSTVFTVKVKIPLKTFLYTLSFIFFSAVVFGQETAPELELDEYRIIGRDTRVFSITGDRLSSVELVSFPLALTEEQHNVESSKGLISEAARLRRTEAFSVTRGLGAQLDYCYGAHALNSLLGKFSAEIGNAAVTINMLNRSAEANTRSVSPLLSQGIETVFYYKGVNTSYMVFVGISQEDDDAVDSGFHPGSRAVNRYHAGINIQSPLNEIWDLNGRFQFNGGSFQNFEKPGNTALLIDEDEISLEGTVSAARDYSFMTASFQSSAEYGKLGNTSGSVVSAGALGKWNFLNSLGINAGADFYVFAQPDDDTNRGRLYPNAAVDWAITKRSFIRLAYTPGIRLYSYNDLYDRNGLVLMDVPVVIEERTVDFDGSFGLRLRSGLNVSAGGFLIKSKNPAVFNQSGDFFDIVKDTEIELSGYRFQTKYIQENRYGLEGKIDMINASWNFSGDVPYIPSMEVSLDGYYIPFELWIIRTTLQYFGKHSVALNSDDKTDAVFEVDLGVERQLWKEYISMYLDIRNITNSKGSWWTDRYRVPGIGLYLGIKAQY